MSTFTQVLWVLSFLTVLAWGTFGIALMYYVLLWSIFEFVAVAIVDTIRGTRNGN
jgi:hypothetical protein